MSEDFYDVAYVWDETHIMWEKGSEGRRTRVMTDAEQQKWDALIARQEAAQKRMLADMVSA